MAMVREVWDGGSPRCLLMVRVAHGVTFPLPEVRRVRSIQRSGGSAHGEVAVGMLLAVVLPGRKRSGEFSTGLFQPGQWIRNGDSRRPRERCRRPGRDEC